MYVEGINKIKKLYSKRRARLNQNTNPKSFVSRSHSPSRLSTAPKKKTPPISSTHEMTQRASDLGSPHQRPASSGEQSLRNVGEQSGLLGRMFNLVVVV